MANKFDDGGPISKVVQNKYFGKQELLDKQSAEDISKAFSHALLKINELYVTVWGINPHFSISMTNEIIGLMLSNERKPCMIYLEGPPGSGKTHTLLTAMPEILEGLAHIYEVQKGINAFKALENVPELKEMLDRFMRSKNLRKSLERFSDSRVVAKMLERVVSYYSEIEADMKERPLQATELEEEKKALKAEVFRFLGNLIRMPEYLKFPSSEKDRVHIEVCVVPAQSEVTEPLGTSSYLIKPVKIGDGEIIKEQYKIPFLKTLEKAFKGEISIFVFDELSEIPRNVQSADKRPKELHTFLDLFLNKNVVSFSFEPSKLNEETYLNLKSIMASINNLLKDRTLIGKVFGLASSEDIRNTEAYLKNAVLEIQNALEKYEKKEPGIVRLLIPAPSMLMLFGTGNVRSSDERNPVGLHPSTEERVHPIKFTYLTPEKLEEFLLGKDGISGYVEKLIKLLEAQLVSPKEANKKMLEKQSQKLKEFAMAIIKNYENLFKEFESDPERYSSRMLPSLRTIAGMLRIYASYIFLNQMLNYIKEKDISAKLPEVIKVNIRAQRILKESTINVTKEEFPFLGNERAFSTMLFGMMRFMTHLNVGSYTRQSETPDSEELRSKLRKGAGELKSMLGVEGLGHTILLKQEGDTLVYSEPYYYYLLSTLAGIIGGQRFFLYIGSTQEGKTTMAEAVPHLLKVLNNELGLSYKEIKFSNLNSDEVTLKSTNVEAESVDGKRAKMQESKLVSTLREASRNPEKLFIILVNEIDSVQSSQELNTVLTQNSVDIDGEILDISNVRIMGTMNISSIILDNFLSRSVIPLIFIDDLSRVAATTINIDADQRNMAYIYEVVLSITQDEDLATLVLKMLINKNDPKGRLQVINNDFDDVVKATRSSISSITDMIDTEIELKGQIIDPEEKKELRKKALKKMNEEEKQLLAEIISSYIDKSLQSTKAKR
ncbi:MAG: hypothetical protein QW035_03940 [Candidatus Anstonellales archaeon]